MAQDNDHNALRYTMRRPMWPFSIAVIVALVAIIAFKMEVSDLRTADDDGSITIVSGSSARQDKHSRLQGAVKTPDFGASEKTIRSDDNAARLPVGSPVRLLHDSITAERKDNRWGEIAGRQINHALSSVPYISGERELTCGTIRCELSVKMDKGISNTNANLVSSAFYSIPNTDDGTGVIVEGVFPTVDPDGTKRLNVIYMRH